MKIGNKKVELPFAHELRYSFSSSLSLLQHSLIHNVSLMKHYGKQWSNTTSQIRANFSSISLVLFTIRNKMVSV